MALKDSFPYRALRYAGRLPGRLYSKYITEPIIKRWIKQSELMVYVHDPRRGLLRPIVEGQRLKWTLKENISIDATYWLDVIEPLLSNQDIVFDVGTNIGSVANWFANRTKHVHCFEPHPDNLRMTTEQIEIRKTKNITLSQIALGCEPGTLHLNVKSFHGHHSLVDTKISPTIEKIEVEVDTVDRYCRTKNIEQIDFLKIDVEGFEEEVLKGAKDMLSHGKVRLVLFEHRAAILSSVGKHGKDIFTPLLDNGYTVFTLDGKKLTSQELDNPPDADFLAAMNPDEFIHKLGESSAPVL